MALFFRAALFAVFQVLEPFDNLRAGFRRFRAGALARGFVVEGGDGFGSGIADNGCRETHG